MGGNSTKCIAAAASGTKSQTYGKREKKALLILCPEDSLQYYRTLLAFNKNLVAVLEHPQLGCFPLVF